MKIAIIDSLIGNDYSLCLSRHLSESGGDVTFIVPENRKINIPINFTIKYWAPSKGISYGKLKKISNYLKFFLKLTRYLLSSNTEVVHYQFFRRERPDSLMFFIQSLLGIRLIYTAHNIFPHERNKLDYFFKYLIYKSADVIIVHSLFIKNSLLQSFKISAEKIKIIPHGNFDHYLSKRDISKQEARESLNLSSSDQVLLFFGYIREYKGLDLLLDAFSLAAESNVRLKLIIAGSPHTSELKKIYEQKIETISSRNRIAAFLHFIPSEDIAHYFIASDIVALPYKNIYHSGIMHLAFTFARPIIATRVGDFEETLKHGKSGFLVSTFEAEKFAQTINDAFSNKYNLEKMGAYNQMLNNTKYSWQRIAEQTLKVYDGQKVRANSK